MDRYQRVEKPRAETPIDENEIRITSQGRMRSYISYAMSLLQEKGADEIVFKAMGRAINKTVTIVELIKRRIVGLHQITSIGSTDITDTWEPLEEGLLPLETTRHVSMITITLSKKELDTASVGYQPPLPEDQRDLLMAEGEVVVAGEGQGAEGMDMCLVSTKMVVGTNKAIPGAGVGVGVEDVADSAAVVEVPIMVLLLLNHNRKMVASMMLLLKPVGVAVGEVDTVEGAVVEVDRMDQQSRQLHDNETLRSSTGILVSAVFFSWQ
ncbi:unnamed protein product [Linum tenue]|nr:unnamed protein product [Linum tenue]